MWDTDHDNMDTFPLLFTFSGAILDWFQCKAEQQQAQERKSVPELSYFFDAEAVIAEPQNSARMEIEADEAEYAKPATHLIW